MAKVNVGSRSLGIEPITQSQFLYYYWVIGYGKHLKHDSSLEQKLTNFLNQVPLFIAFLAVDKNIEITDLEIDTGSILKNLVMNMLEGFDVDEGRLEYVKNVYSTKLPSDSPLLTSKIVSYKKLANLFSDCIDWIKKLELPLPEINAETLGVGGAILLPGSIKSLKVKIKKDNFAQGLIKDYISYFMTDSLNEADAPWYYADPYFQAIPFKKQLFLFTRHVVQQINRHDRNVILVNSDEFLRDKELSDIQVLELLILLAAKRSIDIENLDVSFVPTSSKVIPYNLKARISLPIDFYKEVIEETKSYELALSFKGVGTAPIVRYKTEEYELPSMQADNNPFLIINYCLNKAPGEYVKLQTIKTIPGVKGVSNINEVLKNSAFGSKRALHIFVDSSAKSIKVENNVPASQRELEAIKKESVRQKS